MKMTEISPGWPLVQAIEILEEEARPNK
jgi:hypothetical protein